jgi:L-threonylcarbamoyladenylate synthase
MQDTATLADTLERLHEAGRKVALIHYSDLPATHAPRSALPATPEGFAHALYAALRAMDGAAPT